MARWEIKPCVYQEVKDASMALASIMGSMGLVKCYLEHLFSDRDGRTAVSGGLNGNSQEREDDE